MATHRTIDRSGRKSLTEWWHALRQQGFPRASTRRLWRMAKEAGRPWWQFAHTFFYARWPYGFIGSAIGERWQRRLLLPFFVPFLIKTINPWRWADSYHGKVMSTETARRLVSVREEVQQTIPEQAIPFEHARDIILSDPEHIVVLDCPCRVSRHNPCLPLDVCLIVGEPFASFVLDHHPNKARAISSQEAVEILEAEAKRGHAHHAFFKEAMLNRFYAICNCCECCCGAVSATRHGIPMSISSGYVAQIDAARCQRCGTCVKTCPFHALSLTTQTTVDDETCMGCGGCTRVCPSGAITLRRDERKPAPMVFDF